MSHRFSRRFALAVLLLMAACVSGPARRTDGVNMRLISEEELLASRYANAFEVVQALRPNWLRMRGRTSINQSESVKVYIDNSLMGGPEHLQQITTSSISEIRFLDANEATHRWGFDHGQGAIMVSTRARPGTTTKTP